MLKARSIVDVEYYLRRARGCGEDRTAYYLGREESAGRWVGGRAEEFGLVGELDREHDHDTFRRLVTGGTLPGQTRRASQYSHKVKGWDLCTSAPKSVSILAALGAAGVSAAAVEAHEAATAAALSYMESVVNEIRRGTDGEVREPAVPGLIGVEFRHREARPCKGCDHGDPQLHSHTVVANIQQSATDGKWFAIDGKVFVRHEKAAGALYQSVLRHELTARLGVTWTAPVKGLAEIAGIKTSWLRHFSKRSTAMAEYLAEAKLIDSPSARQTAVLATRLPKGERLDEATLREKYAAEAGDVGLTPEELTRALARSGQRVTRETDWETVGGRLLGVDGLTASEATFCRRDVLRDLARAAQVGGGVDELDEQVARVLGSADVVPVLSGRDPVTGGLLPGHDPREPRYTTRAQLNLEALVLDGIERRRGDGSGVVPDAVADAAIVGDRTVRLGEDQDRAVRGLLADRNGVAVLIAPAGAGKTTSIAVARAGWEAAGLKVEGCAPTAKAAAELGDRGGMPTHTCAQVLAYDQRKAGMPAGGVMVIDEAGMLGTRDLGRLLKAADEARTKVVLVGDPSQLQPISAGGLLRGIAAQVGAQELTANRRQQQRLDRDALARMRAGDGAAAIDRLVAEGRVMVADSQPATWAACVADWWKAARDNPTQAQMIARTNEDVRALNQHAREIVAAEGRLSGPVVSNRFADFQAGDRIECRNTSALSRKHGVANRDIGVVRAVEDGGLVVDLDREARVRLPAAYLPHVQHGYAVTCHGVQGATYDHTYVLGAGSREWTYTALSRHRVDTAMYLSASQSDDGELDLPRQLRDALGAARRAAAGSEAKPAAVELAPRTQSDAELRAEIEHTAETLRTRPVYAKAMPDADERLAKRSDWDLEHASDLVRGPAAAAELRWRQHARTVAREVDAPEVKAPTIERTGPVLERVS